MKRFSSILIILLLCLPIMVLAARRGALRVSLSDHSPIAVSIDGRLFKKYGSSLTVGDLPKGWRYIKIYSYDPKNEQKPLKSIYTKDVRIHKDELTIIVLDVYSGKARISYQDWNAANMPQGKEVKQPGRVNLSPAANAPVTSAGASQVASEPVLDDFTAANATIIGGDDWASLQTDVKSKVTDTEKLNAVKVALKDKSVSTAQVSTIMQWFNFEESKLGIAQWCYNHTVDKSNYSILKTGLTSREHIDKLDAFIKSRS